MEKKEVGREDRMHFLVRTETEFKYYRRQVDEPYSKEEIKVMKRMARAMNHITGEKQVKKEK